MASTFRGGVRIDCSQSTEYSPIVDMPAPAVIYIPVSLPTNLPCIVSVQPGQAVYKGQQIAESEDHTCPIHTPVSGTVKTICPFIDRRGRQTDCIVIENDFADTLDPSVIPFSKPLAEASSEEIIEMVKTAGIFDTQTESPCYAKMSAALGKAKKLIVNCLDREPCLSSSYRLLLEDPRSVIGGALILMRALHLAEGVFVTDTSKTDVAASLKDHIRHNDMLRVFSVKAKYPQSGERQLIYAVDKIEIPVEKNPADIGFAVFDANTCHQIYRAFVTGLPPVDRLITVDGDCVVKPQNLRVIPGTPVSDVINFCGGLKKRPTKIIDGGVMTGIALQNPDTPIGNDTSAILVFSSDLLIPQIKDPVCIHCGNCVRVCPMHLLPNYFSLYTQKGLYERCADFHLFSCIECGCCAYSCPADIPIVRHIRTAKEKIQKTNAAQP